MKKYYLILAITSVSLMVSGCDKLSDTRKLSGEEVEEVKEVKEKNLPTESVADSYPVYKVAIEKDAYPPFEFQNEYGVYIGYDFDLMRAISEEMKFRVEFKPLPFSEVLTSLENDSNDIAISAITVSEERLSKYFASDPYIKTGNTFLLPENKQLKDISNLIGKKVAVQESGYQAAVIKEIEGLIAYPVTTNFLGLQSVTTGQSAALFADRTMLFSLTAQYPEYKFNFLSHGKDTNLAIFTKQGNNEVLAKINEGLKKVKANGKYQQINEKWFGDNAKNIAVD